MIKTGKGQPGSGQLDTIYPGSGQINSGQPGSSKHTLSGDLLTIFSCLWAIATAFHLAAFSARQHSFDEFVLGFAVVYVLNRPASVQRFMFLVCCQLYMIATSMPYVSNHWLLTGFVNLTILLSYILLVLKKRAWSIDRGEFYETFAPVVRIELLILYFYVVFHKLNTDFLTPGISCGSIFYAAQSSASFLPTSNWFIKSNIYLTLIIEVSIPILLCFRRTLLSGLFIGAVFHAIIAYNPLQPFYDFSSAVFALYFLFVPIDIVNDVWNKWKKTKLYQRLSTPINLPYSNWFLLTIGFAGLFAFGILLVLDRVFTDFFRNIFWTAFSLVYISFVVTALLMKQKSGEFPQKLFSVKYGLLWLMPVVVFLNGACPYLGLKTESSFAMFSNLRTEGGQTNHLIIPASTQVFGFQKDMIEVISSSDVRMQKLADEAKLITFFELRRHVASSKPFTISYIRQGKRVDVAKTSASSEFARPLPLIWRGLFYFRTINKYQPQPCSH